MNDGDAIGIIDNTDLERLTVGRRPDEHGDVGIIGLEASPVMSKGVEHVVIDDAVLAGARLDVHPPRLRTRLRIVNIH